MRRRKTLRAAALLACASAACCGCDKDGAGDGAATRPGGGGGGVGEYLGALAAANDFCAAWRAGDVAAAKAVLSQRVLEHHPAQRIAGAVEGGANVAHSGFELAKGRRRDDGAYVFPLRIYLKYYGRGEDRIEARDVRLVIIREEASWRVDEAPLLK